jgi:hypothetical protein
MKLSVGKMTTFQSASSRRLELPPSGGRESTFLSVTSDVFVEEDKHYVSVFMHTPFSVGQKIINMEPDKVEAWGWYDLDNLPEKLFLPLSTIIKRGDLKIFNGAS